MEAKPMMMESEKQARKRRATRCWTAMAIAKCGFWGLEFPFVVKAQAFVTISLPFPPMSATLYNRKSPAVKRILQEALELQKDPSVEYFARPLEVSSHLLVLLALSVFHSHKPFGPPRTTFSNGTLPYVALLKRNLTAGGESCLQYRPASVTACQAHAYSRILFNRYHGRILLPNEYPFKPPELMLLTRLSGKTDTEIKIPNQRGKQPAGADMSNSRCCVYFQLTLQPNGRFELNKKICLSITGYHPEFWQPAWGSTYKFTFTLWFVRTVMLGIMGFFPTKANGAIGGIDYTENERKILASR
ncbi:hypothetical protein BC937DRAFT_87022 [Endogone sp. FLAS-F59071]|nr:hypothetical protein BC937DRAFT_87022 [Endogone sp. FLAS-F59071]|eukprot:RUS19732.1 hypothetical protein BC937DRAFT_87022 [Endogone sp. FLAS-F59071]